MVLYYKKNGDYMQNEFIRTEMLIGREAIEKLNKTKVAIFGVGGVGGYAFEGLIRSGVGSIDVFDNDDVNITNINRQIIALHSTIGRKKVDVIKERGLLINPNAIINTFDSFVLESNIDNIDFSQYDYIIDAIDTVNGKLAIIEKAKRLNIKVISSMGTGSKLNPLDLKVTDISKTKGCPLARVMRTELKKRNITELKVVYSEEEVKPCLVENPPLRESGRPTPSSISFVPSVAGLIIASEVIKDLIK